MSLLSDDELNVRAISVRAGQLVYLKHILEADCGIAFLIAARGGDALLVSPKSQSGQLDEFIEDMKCEIGLRERVLLASDEALNVAG